MHFNVSCHDKATLRILVDDKMSTSITSSEKKTSNVNKNIYILKYLHFKRIPFFDVLSVYFFYIRNVQTHMIPHEQFILCKYELSIDSDSPVWKNISCGFVTESNKERTQIFIM